MGSEYFLPDNASTSVATLLAKPIIGTNNANTSTSFLRVNYIKFVFHSVYSILSFRWKLMPLL